MALPAGLPPGVRPSFPGVSRAAWCEEGSCDNSLPRGTTSSTPNRVISWVRLSPRALRPHPAPAARASLDIATRSMEQQSPSWRNAASWSASDRRVLWPESLVVGYALRGRKRKRGRRAFVEGRSSS
jgi:hypothetical protein